MIMEITLPRLWIFLWFCLGFVGLCLRWRKPATTLRPGAGASEFVMFFLTVAALIWGGFFGKLTP